MSKYNPKIHDRKSIRLKGYDYTQAGLYFITICVHNRKHLFGKIENGEMILNDYGTIAHQQWEKLQERFPNFKLDTFQIMPNHMHAIISLAHSAIPVRAGFTPAPHPGQPQGLAPTIESPHPGQPQGLAPTIESPHPGQPQGLAPTIESPHPGQPQGLALPTIGDIIGTYKSLVANESLKIFKQNWVGPNPIPRMGKIWQRNYYEHIIRTERAYHHIAEYIINNPKNWEADKFHRNSQSSKPKKTENITF